MKLPERVLRQVRGPLLVAAIAGCSSAPAASPSPPPTPSPPVATVAPEPADPVDYDADREAARLERLDRALAAAETRRERRIDDETEARRRAHVRASIGRIGDVPDYVLAACGRG